MKMVDCHDNLLNTESTPLGRIRVIDSWADGQKVVLMTCPIADGKINGIFWDGSAVITFA